MANIPWTMKGPSYGTCNCNWGCPCQFDAPPTDGTCRGLDVMRIDERRFGDVRLDGLYWVMTVNWPGAVHEGNGSQQAIIDVRADDKQRESLVKILHGEETEPGATMLQVYNATMTTVHEPLFEPIEFDCDIEKRTARLEVPGMIASVGEPIRNPVTGKEHRARVILPDGFEYSEAEYGSGTTRATGAVPLDLKNSYGQFAMLHLTQSGPVR
ncbi:MAG: DUF1326 domain-containing protein [Nitrospinota bacterium]|jgi:hypothetical protein|nr:DUF1326 domain-containing protein [Nitrospinota bacterium]MDP6619398.1 DUF1326 domain-containing protein [Nitrospinota bacterium]HJM42145.1 DUF1326 domain-containing protein [Nitrospinota bacterium]